GCRWRLVASRAGEPLHDAACDEAFALARAGVDAGRPTLLFGVHTGEFGLARGYQRPPSIDGRGNPPDALLVSGLLDGGAPDTLPRARLAVPTGILFALQLVERLPVDDAAAARAVLVAAAAHL